MSEIQKVLDERGANYGKFPLHALIAQNLKQVLRTAPSWHRCSAEQKEALEMIAHKMARIVNGDPDYLDSWVDMIGYTQLVVNELTTTK